MGCCQSAASNENHVPPPAPLRHARLPHDSSRAAINQPSRSLSDVASPRASSTAPASAQKPEANSRPNQPLRPPTPLASSPAHVSHRPPPWTHSQLQREREAFFDTRVSGQPEIWTSLKYVCEMLREGNLSEAQLILDAMSLTCPNGRVAEGRGRDRAKGGVYDERGQLYAIPAWVLTDLEDVVEEDEEKYFERGTDGARDTTADDTDGAAMEGERGRGEKGKGKEVDLGEQVSVRARLSDRGTDIAVTVGMKQKVSVIVRRIQEQIGNRRIRLAYLGKVLEENRTLEQHGWKAGNVLNALVFEGDESMIGTPGAK